VEFRLALPLDTRAPHAARDALDALGDHVPLDLFFALKLVVSELVTNTFQHSGLPDGTPVQLLIGLSPERVRVQVSEPKFTAMANPQPTDAESGRGLYIVSQMSDRWGQEPDQGVWAEFDLT
jgi:anti-sigma regulatory factor (Ser/Thr protein kinase)